MRHITVIATWVRLHYGNNCAIDYKQVQSNNYVNSYIVMYVTDCKQFYYVYVTECKQLQCVII